jgi:hypothetical protein
MRTGCNAHESGDPVIRSFCGNDRIPAFAGISGGCFRRGRIVQQLAQARSRERSGKVVFRFSCSLVTQRLLG